MSTFSVEACIPCSVREYLYWRSVCCYLKFRFSVCGGCVHVCACVHMCPEILQLHLGLFLFLQLPNVGHLRAFASFAFPSAWLVPPGPSCVSLGVASSGRSSLTTSLKQDSLLLCFRASSSLPTIWNYTHNLNQPAFPPGL